MGAGELPTAKITVNGMSWYDGNPSNGGKRWLNPYAPDAHRYLIDMAAELKNLGVTGLMLDGVQFPEQESQADYGSSSLTSLGRGQVLQKFVTDLSAAFGDGQVILSMPGLAGFGEDTEVFGGNPLTFGEAVAAPVLLPSALGNRLSVGENTVTDPAAHPYEAVQLAMSQLSLRVQLMEETARPAIMPCSRLMIIPPSRSGTRSVGSRRYPATRRPISCIIPREPMTFHRYHKGRFLDC